MKLGIVITTYYRPDGRTKEYLTRALISVDHQNHKDYQVYVIGDYYSNEAEFQIIRKEFPSAIFVNLGRAVEREKYPFGSMQLWSSGGITAVKYGVDLALGDGLQYICHLDHDDYWFPDHLEKINQVIEEKSPFFVCTISTWMNRLLPELPVLNEIVEFYPRPEGMISSSVCVKYSDTTLRSRDVFVETGKVYPADADLWRRLTEEMKEKGRKGYCYTSLTCRHDEEGYSLRCRQRRFVT